MGSATDPDLPVVILGSGSPSRLALLRRAGLDPKVVVSGVDESALPGESPSQLTMRLAQAKASVVAASITDGVVIGCDSLLELDGVGYGKPGSPEPALELWQLMAGRSATFRTGHCVIDAGSGQQASALCSTAVTFVKPSMQEIAAYVRSGEPLSVAGAFKIDHKGGWFVERIEGEPSNLQGLSLPLLRRLLEELGISITQLWT